MRIIAYDRFKPGVTMQDVTPYLPEEVSNVWRLWKAGIVRENYARADEPGVVIIFELRSATWPSRRRVRAAECTRTSPWSKRLPRNSPTPRR